jgi:hypothetical protein
VQPPDGASEIRTCGGDTHEPWCPLRILDELPTAPAHAPYCTTCGSTDVRDCAPDGTCICRAEGGARRGFEIGIPPHAQSNGRFCTGDPHQTWCPDLPAAERKPVQWQYDFETLGQPFTGHDSIVTDREFVGCCVCGTMIIAVFRKEAT